MDLFGRLQAREPEAGSRDSATAHSKSDGWWAAKALGDY